MATVATDQDAATQPVKKPVSRESGATTPLTGSAPSALPVAGQPAATAPNVQTLGGSSPFAPVGGAGAPSASQGGVLPVAPAQTSDPMAFQPPPVSSVPGATQFGLPGGVGDPNAGILGGDEAAKNEYWAKQGVGIAPSALGVAPTGVGANGVNTYDPNAVASAQSKLQGQNTPAVSSLLSQLTGPNGAGADIAGRSAVSDTQNAASRADDEARYIQSAEKAGGVYNPGQAIGGAFGNDVVPGNLVNANPNVTGSATSPGGDTLGARIQPPTGPANDVGTPSSGLASDPIQQIIQAAGQNSGQPMSGQNVSSDPRVGNGVSTTPTTPDNALTNSTISVDPGVDRFKVANTQLQDTIHNILDPAEKAGSRAIAQNSFGAGRGVSGMNRTSQGNLESDYNNQRNQLASSFLNPALTGTIQDAYNNAGIAQQQQGFQAGQQQTGFNQAVTGQQLADNENNQSFNQALQQLLVGSQGDPAQVQLILAQLLGGQSATNAQAAQRLAGSV